MTEAMISARGLGSAASVLAFARDRRAAADRAEAQLLDAACAWADLHPAESIDEAETIHAYRFGDTGIPVAGEGAPWVAEFAIAEFAAAIGLPTETGKRYVGEALELRHRLPKVWSRLQSGDLAAWKARRVAQATMHLTKDAAAFVDLHVASVAHKIRPSQLDALVDEAIARLMPDLAAERRRKAADGRHFVVDTRQVSFAGTCQVWGELDLPDALDLDDALSMGAEQLKSLGSMDSLDVRRAAAAGELSRRQPALEFSAHGDDAGERAQSSTAGPSRVSRRKAVLYVHLSEAALRGQADGAIGRVEKDDRLVTAETVRDWLGHSDASISVRPVLDLADQLSSTSYEIPDRLAEQVVLRDGTCVFPWCTRSARSCDLDHITPHGEGGSTASDNLAPLCRRHHRLKTHGGWTYTVIEPGSYLWRSRLGYHYLRDHTGTLHVSRDVGRDVILDVTLDVTLDVSRDPP